MGDSRTDAIRTADLCEEALEFSIEILDPGGIFIGKYFSGPEEMELKEIARKEFTKVATVKPPASRKESSERYLVAQGRR
jgi:23S rRNA (uridine2552-2'-O)-methyltransferase